MDIVTISPKYQVVIPWAVRERLQLEPRQQVQALVHGDRIEQLPARSARSLRGFLRGIDTQIDHEPDRC